MTDAGALPQEIMGYVSVRSQGGVPITAASREFLHTGSMSRFHGSSEDFEQARKALEAMGFKIISESRLGMAISGPPAAYEELTGGSVVAHDHEVSDHPDLRRTSRRVDVTGHGQPKEIGVGAVKHPSSGLEAVILDAPKRHHGAILHTTPPKVAKHHFSLPDDLAPHLGATDAHTAGHRGKGVLIAMIDTGHYDHPFFQKRGYRILPPIPMVPRTDAAVDPIGHGTGESANIFALAPEATLAPIRVSDDGGHLVGSFAGWLAAKRLKPHVITCSWGGDGPYPPREPPASVDLALLAEILDAIESGICVVFSAGNGEFYLAPQPPQVIAVGGATIAPDGALTASDFASGYPSPWYQGRTVPDVCGIIGVQPRGQYLMLPVPAGSPLDKVMSQPAADGIDDGDGTSGDDGWALFSGTSAAAPQIAGIAAMIICAKPGIRPAQIAETLRQSAKDVVTGACHRRFSNRAAPGPDAATGYGLAQASPAVAYALHKF